MYQIFSNQIQKVHNEGKEFIILTDENLNSLDDVGNSSYCRNIELKNIRDYNIINYDLTYHNNQPTFYRKGIKSCIDFIISNCPTKIYNVKTHYNGDDIHQYKDTNYHNIMSDHIMISCSYNNKTIKATQQFQHHQEL